MKIIKKIVTFAILISIFTNNLSVFASEDYSKKEKRNAIETFKKEMFDNIYNWENIFVDKWLNFIQTREDIVALEKQLSDLDIEYDKISKQKNVIETRIWSLEDILTEIDGEISDANLKILTFSQDINSWLEEVNLTKQEIEWLSEKIKENRDVLFDYIIHIYKKQNFVSTEWKDIDALKTIFLTNWNLSQLISELNFTTILELAWQQLLNEYKNLSKDLFVKNEELKKNITNIRILRAKETLEKNSLTEKKQFREKLLWSFNWDKNSFSKNMALVQKEKIQVRAKLAKAKYELNKQKQVVLSDTWCELFDYNDEVIQKTEEQLKVDINLYKELLKSKDEYKDVDFDELVEKIQNKLDPDFEQKKTCNRLSKILDLEARLTRYVPEQENKISWPVNPVNWLSAYYRDQEYLEEIWAEHEAIDIPLEQGTDITAPADWYITFKKDPVDKYYSYAVMKHADWMVTVYGHLNEILVEQYAYVEAWEVFAKSGWKIWENGSWIMTTWPHLHFEVLVNKEYVDPLELLDLTALWADKIPNNQKYYYKFLQDYKINNWEDFVWETSFTDEFILNWENEIERQKDLLTRYWVWWFSNWDMWVEEAVTANVDPSFLMCIGLSETALWRNLKTPYNVWNVWNVDSGWTWEFPNARTWVYWIARTLNNKYLSKYDKMKYLTRYWNKDGAIYASSSYNWQKNMIRCLSSLKQEYISDDYNFRMIDQLDVIEKESF